MHTIYQFSGAQSKFSESDADLLLRKGLALDKSDQYEEALASYSKALAIFEDVLGKDHPKVATCLVNMSKVYESQEKWSDVESVLKRAIIIDKTNLGSDHFDVGLDQHSLSFACLKQMKYADAEKYAKEALNVFKSQSGANKAPAIAFGLFSLADVQGEAKKYSDAERNYKEAIAIYENMKEPPRIFVNVLMVYSALLRKMGRESEATALETRAKKIQEEK